LRLRTIAKRCLQQRGSRKKASKIMQLVRQNTGPLVSCNGPENTVVYQLDKFGATLLDDGMLRRNASHAADDKTGRSCGVLEGRRDIQSLLPGRLLP
jgi:hypothetical protein